MPHSRRAALASLTRAGLCLTALAPGRALAAPTRNPREDPSLAAAFAANGATGTMALLTGHAGEMLVYNARRATTRFIPASSFKLANSLIALETGVVADENTIIPYGGKPQPNPAWAHDMSMRQALPISNVAIYQELARRIGLPCYRHWLARLGYGNGQTGTVVDRFWLEGPLAISAVEQAHFANRLAHGTLPMSARAQAIVRDIAHIDSKASRRLCGKTGWTGQNGIGWFTGWVEEGNSVIAAFSLNMPMAVIGEAPKRLAIARDALDRLGLY